MHTLGDWLVTSNDYLFMGIIASQFCTLEVTQIDCARIAFLPACDIIRIGRPFFTLQCLTSAEVARFHFERFVSFPTTATGKAGVIEDE